MLRGSGGTGTLARGLSDVESFDGVEGFREHCTLHCQQHPGSGDATLSGPTYASTVPEGAAFSSDLDTVGRHAAPKAWSLRSARSSSSSTALSPLTPSMVSPEEASLLCRTALADLTSDLAVVRVTSSDRGRVAGLLDWERSLPEDVGFTLIKIKPGYAVVGEVFSGPDIFKQICWKLKSVNGCCDIAPVLITRGDTLTLEGPRWAMERLPHLKRTAAAPACEISSTRGTAYDDDASIATWNAYDAEVVPRGSVVAAAQGEQLQFDLVDAGRPRVAEELTPDTLAVVGNTVAKSSHQSPLVVPRLDLSNLSDQERKASRPGSISGACGLSLAQCGSLWRCL